MPGQDGLMGWCGVQVPDEVVAKYYGCGSPLPAGQPLLFAAWAGTHNSASD
jgi:hypothetical protein